MWNRPKNQLSGFATNQDLNAIESKTVRGMSSQLCFNSAKWKAAGWNFVTSLRLSILVFTAVLITARLTSAQQTVQVVPVEPGIIKLENLFKKSDTVALVKVVSGDTENYATAVYKAEVIQSFKGAAVGEAIYFGPYEGVRLGWEYVLFLRRAAKPLAPKTTAKVSYGTVNYSEVFNEGYSSMETSYECVFDARKSPSIAIMV